MTSRTLEGRCFFQPSRRKSKHLRPVLFLASNKQKLPYGHFVSSGKPSFVSSRHDSVTSFIRPQTSAPQVNS